MNRQNIEKTSDTSDTKAQIGVAPLLLDSKALATMLSIGLSKLYQMNRSGHLGPMPLKFGQRTLWRTEEIAAWVRAGCPRRELWLKMAQDQGFGHQHGRRF